MNLHALKAEDENEKNAIDSERDLRIKRWKAVLDTMDKDELAKKTKTEQTSKMEDLMGKL